MTVTASAVDWLLDSDEPGIVFQAKRDLLGERSRRRLAACSRAQGARAARGTAARRRLRRQRLRQVGRRPLAARLARRARRPGRRAALRRRGRDRARVAHRQGPPRPHPDDRRPDAAVRLAGGETRSPSAAGSGWQATRGSGCSRSRSSSGSGPTAAGTATRRRRATAPRSTSRCRRCGACTSTGPRPARGARGRAVRTAELFLEHRLFRAPRDRRADPRVVRDAAPPAVLALRLPAGARRARPHGPRRRPARRGRLDLVEERRLADGRWRAGGRWWKAARVEGEQRRGRRLGLGPERAADPGRAPRRAARARRRLLSAPSEIEPSSAIVQPGLCATSHGWPSGSTKTPE